MNSPQNNTSPTLFASCMLNIDKDEKDSCKIGWTSNSITLK